MAIVTINLTDTFNAFINKTNDISTVVGDVDNLVTGDSSLVDGLNTIKGLLAAFDDSAEIQNIARNAISVVDNGGDGALSYEAESGRIIYRGPNATEVRAHFSAGVGLEYNEDGQFNIGNNAITNDMIATNTLTSDRFRTRVTLEIKNQNGNTVKTIYSPGN